MTSTLDTNVLVYAFDGRDPAKQAAALEIMRLLGASGGVLALQVIGEFQNAMVKRLKMPAALAAAKGQELLASFRTFPYDDVAVERATASFATSRFSYWDGLLLASAERAGLRYLITEDMHDGAEFGALEIVHAFDDAGGLSRRARMALGAAP
jgi:predicted nucleic acid-binding protein